MTEIRLPTFDRRLRLRAQTIGLLLLVVVLLFVQLVMENRRSARRLGVFLEGDAPLLNPYHVLEVNPARHPKVNAAGGKAFADFLVSAEAQEVIRTYGVERYGQPLFFPDAKRGARGGG